MIEKMQGPTIMLIFSKVLSEQGSLARVMEHERINLGLLYVIT
jgi:hypothetical protein